MDALLLEYDDERSGGFAPLAKVSPDKKVVLGLITTKSAELEKKEDVIARIHEAAKYIPLDRLCLLSLIHISIIAVSFSINKIYSSIKGWHCTFLIKCSKIQLTREKYHFDLLH